MKKIVSVLLMVCVLVASALAGGTSASAAAVMLDIQALSESTDDSTPPPIPTQGDVWDGSIEEPTTLVQKDGTNYYEITKCSQLAYVAQTGAEWLSRNYILANNLILNDVEITWDDDGNCTNGDDLLQWIPIGKSNNSFTGIFEGNGCTVSGLYDVSRKGGICGLFGYIDEASISNVKVVNSYVEVSGYANGYVCGDAGGIVGHAYGSIDSCVYSGIVRGTDIDIDNSCGGICGYSDGGIKNCINYGEVRAAHYGGGIVGKAYSNVESCKNYGNVSCGKTDNSYCLGGIAGDAGDYLISCVNYGHVTGVKNVGGISGRWSGYYYRYGADYNAGNIQGEENVGGIAGYINSSSVNLKGFYNTGTVKGEKYVGGIAGFSEGCNISQAYNIGNVSGTTYVGGITGSDGIVWGKDTISSTYFLQTETVNTGLNGCGSTVAVEGMTACTQSEMLLQSTYQGFDFAETWCMDPNKNGGYPYFSWQTVSEVAVSGVTLNKATLSMGVGDQEYLAAAVTPANASSTGFTWTSSDDEVVTVSQAGKVTALAPGTAQITVTTQDGDYSAVCSVTVAARSQDEYKINSITLKDQNGDILTEIPSGSFWASVSITNQSAAGDSLVMLASYDSNGKYLGVLCAGAKGLSQGATLELSFMMDNKAGQIAKIKAFSISSLQNISPVGQAVSWESPTELN